MERSLIKAKKATVLLELTTNCEIISYQHELKELDAEISRLKDVIQILNQKMGLHENSKLVVQIIDLRRELAKKEADSLKYKELTQVNAQLEDKLKLSHEVITKRDSLQEQLVLANMDLEFAHKENSILQDKINKCEGPLGWKSAKHQDCEDININLREQIEAEKKKFLKLECKWQPLAIQLYQCERDNEAHCKAIALQIEQHDLLSKECDKLKSDFKRVCDANDNVAEHNEALQDKNRELYEELDALRLHQHEDFSAGFIKLRDEMNILKCKNDDLATHNLRLVNINNTDKCEIQLISKTNSDLRELITKQGHKIGTLEQCNTDLRYEMTQNCTDLMRRNTEIIAKLREAEKYQPGFNNLVTETKEQKERIIWLENINRRLTTNLVQATQEIQTLTDENRNLVNHISGEIS